VSAVPKLAAFAAALAAVFGIAAFAGATVGPDRDGATSGEDAADGHGSEGRSAASEGAARDGHDMNSAGADSSAGRGHASAAAADAVRGLAVSSDGLTLAIDRTRFEAGRHGRLAFRILGDRGVPVRDFDVEHEKRMHVIVVRRDGTGFQHLHPRMAADGTWTVPLTLRDAGAYRVFADFSHDGRPRTLAAELTVNGDADYRPFPSPATSADAGDGYAVNLDTRAPRAGEEAELGFEITRDGRTVQPEAYLGARGHLVALREGDLAFLHVHPDENSLAFAAEFPSAARYRLYLQFKHGGEVRTAAFTQAVSR
jgi:hypothetical protein